MQYYRYTAREERWKENENVPCSIYVTRENCEKGIELFENALRLFHEENWCLDPWIINLSKTRYSNSKARDNWGTFLFAYFVTWYNYFYSYFIITFILFLSRFQVSLQVFSFDFVIIIDRFEFLNSNDFSNDFFVDHTKFFFNKIKSTIKTCFTSYPTRAHPCINIYPIRSEETFSFPITLHRDHLRRAIIGLDGIDREEEFVKKERRERGAAQMRPIPLPESVIK